MVSVVFIFNI